MAWGRTPDASGTDLQERLSEHQRARALLMALERAAVSMARARDPQQIYVAVGETLAADLGVFTTVMTFVEPGGSELQIAYLGRPPSVITVAETLLSVRREDYRVRVDSSPFHQRVLWQREIVYVSDPTETLKQSLPSALGGLAGAVIRILGIGRMVGAPLIVGDELRGMLIVSGGALAEGDVPAVHLFAHQMGAALESAELLAALCRRMEELDRTHAQLLQAQKLEAVGRLAGGVAHDLNNLLTAIRLSVEHVRSGSPGDTAEDLATIDVAATRASELVRRLLLFSRRSPVDSRVVELDTVVDETLALLDRVVGEDIEVVRERAPVPALVLADAGQLGQVLANLAINARDAMPRGGRLRISTDVRTFPDGRPAVVLEVADSGTGIPDSALPHLFDPFFTTKGEGTGLGLSIVHGIVTDHGGTVEVRTGVGVGSTFTVRLPVSEEVRSIAPTVRPPPDRSAAPLSILVVEDEATVRAAVVRLLERSGHRAVAVGSTAEARRVFVPGRFRVALCDVQLPDGDGPSLMEALVAEDPDLRVVMSSGYVDERARMGAVRDRGWRMLAKPYTPAALTALLDELVLSAPSEPAGRP